MTRNQLIICYLLLPVLLLSNIDNSYSKSQSSVQIKTVVIDPGHGGKDPGAINNNFKEKDITLSVSLLLGKMIEEKYPNVTVKYTRSDDRFIPVYERANTANKIHADLFISIHVNSAKAKGAMGSETFVMGLDKSNSNFEVCQLENSVVVLEDDYTSKYEGFDPKNPESYIIFSLLQNSHLEQSLIFAGMIQENMGKGPIYHNRGIKQDIFLVLWKCTMPSVLVELGFISNPSDLLVLTNKSNHERMAKGVFNAFEKYKEQYETKIDLPVTIVEKAPSTHYRIQVMSTQSIIKNGSPQMKGYDLEYIKRDKSYKYTFGRFNTREEAKKELNEIKKAFPQAFIITISE